MGKKKTGFKVGKKSVTVANPRGLSDPLVGKAARVYEQLMEPEERENRTPTDHKSVGVAEVRNATFLKWAYDVDRQWQAHDIKMYTPDEKHLDNYEVSLGKLGKLLILDNYGDEVMSDKIRKAILGRKMFKETIGILCKTGEIVRVAYIKEGHTDMGCPEEGVPESTRWEYSLTFFGFGKQLFLPKAYMERVDELKSKKRPFYLTLWENALYGFTTRWASYADLQASIVVDLHFDKQRLQVWSGGGHRKVSAWESNDNPNDPEYHA